MKDLIEVFPNILDSDNCRTLIETFEKSDNTQKSRVFSPGGSEIEHQIRRSSSLILTPERYGTQYASVSNAFRQAYLSYRQRYPFLQKVKSISNEAFTMLRYKVTQSFTVGTLMVLTLGTDIVLLAWFAT